MVSPGKVEIGQGIVTALAQIAADELDVDIGRVQMIRASTAGSPNEGVTSGSLSVQQSGRAIRQACAEIRQIFLTAASDQLGVGTDALDIKDGTISGPGNIRTSYWELADKISLDRDATPGAVPKQSAKRAVAGNSVQRLDIPDKVFAHPRFIHDTALPGMLHGRVLRSELSAAKLTGLKEDAARAVPGLVAIVRDGNFAGVVSQTEAGAEAALTALRKGATWTAGETLPDENGLAEWLKVAAVGTDGDRQENGIRGARKGAHDPAAIYPPLYRARLDRAVLRHGAMERRPRSRLDPQPGRLFSPRRPRAGSETAAREHHGRAHGGRRLLRPQRRRRCRARCGAAGESRRRPAGPRIVVARGRAVACAVRGGDGDRDRGRSRCARRDRRLASLDLGQRSHRAAGARGAAGAARGDRTGQSVSALHRHQSAAGQWRRRRSQLGAAV